ncbi:MAG: glycoside hydrolase family 97 protein [Planctomycetota bacterium]
MLRIRLAVVATLALVAAAPCVAAENVAAESVAASAAADKTAEAQAGTHAVASPDGVLRVEFSLVDGAPRYSASRMGAEIIGPSRMGFKLVDAPAMDAGFVVESVQRNSADTTWTQPWGEVRQVRDHHNELRIALRQKDHRARRLVVVFRVFNDGLAFRYEFPKQPNLGEFNIADELTEFAFASEAQCWWVPAFDQNRYEYVYNQTPLSEAGKVQTPFTLQTADGLCLSVHEAALTDYSSMALTRGEGTKYGAELYPWSDGTKVRAATPFVSPWRTVQAADRPGDLLASTMILNLNEPCQLEDTSWIKPGKYVGVWWEMHVGRSTWGSGEKHGATTENTKRFIDFAAKYGFDGVLVEGWNVGWDGNWMENGEKFSFTQPYPDFDLEGLAAYAAERGVTLVGHHETAGAIAHYEAQLDDAMRLYNRLGVKAVKTGYVEFADGIDRIDADGTRHGEWHHGQFMVRHYRRVAQKAAENRVMVIAHEPIKDTGIRRTLPNFISREGARGQEYNAWSGDGRNPPSHTTVLPFTRMLSGPIDFTPGVFDLKLNSGDRPNDQVSTTLAKQLALYVVLYSPMQMAVDFPEVYEQKLDALQFIRDVAVDWEESRVLDGQIGDYIVVARRQRGGGDWFLGAITDEHGRVLPTLLGFLDRGRRYKAEIYRDANDAHWDTNPEAYVVEEQTVDANTVLTLRLAPGGGQAIRFTPLPPE